VIIFGYRLTEPGRRRASDTHKKTAASGSRARNRLALVKASPASSNSPRVYVNRYYSPFIVNFDKWLDIAVINFLAALNDLFLRQLRRYGRHYFTSLIEIGFSGCIYIFVS